MFRVGDNSSMLMKWSAMDNEQISTQEVVEKEVNTGEGTDDRAYQDGMVKVGGRGGRVIQTRIQSGIQRSSRTLLINEYVENHQLPKGKKDILPSQPSVSQQSATQLLNSHFAEPVGGWIRSYGGGDGYTIVFDDSFEHEVSLVYML